MIRAFLGLLRIRFELNGSSSGLIPIPIHKPVKKTKKKQTKPVPGLQPAGQTSLCLSAVFRIRISYMRIRIRIILVEFKVF
jgi:hypothetical protein